MIDDAHGVIDQLATALAAAQRQFRPILRERTVRVISRSGAQYTFSYAPLETVIAAVREALTDNGLAMTQSISEDGSTMLTTLLHASGQSWTTRFPIVRGEATGPQAWGSAVKYARRYAAEMTLNVVSEDDDDGNVAESNQLGEAILAHPINPTDGAKMTERGQKLLGKLRDAFAAQDSALAYVVYLDVKALELEEGLAVWRALDSSQKTAIKAQEKAKQIQSLKNMSAEAKP